MENNKAIKKKAPATHGPGRMMGGVPDKPKDLKGSLTKLAQYLKPHWVALSFVIIFSIASTAFSIVSPKMLGNVTNDIVDDYIRMKAYDNITENLPEYMFIENGKIYIDPTLLPSDQLPESMEQSTMNENLTNTQVGINNLETSRINDPNTLPIQNLVPKPQEISLEELLNNIPEEQKGNLTDKMVDLLEDLDLSERPTIKFESIKNTILFLIALYLISVLFNIIQSLIISGVTQKITYKLRKELSIKIHTLPLKYFDNRNIGDVMSVVTNDVDVISQNLNQSLSQTISSVAMVVGILAMMFSISWQMTVVAILVLPLSMVAVMMIVKKSQKYYTRQQQILGAVNGHIEETFTGHLIVKAFNREDKEQKRFATQNEKLYETGWKSQFLSGLMMPIIMLVGNIGYVAIAVLGGWLAVNNKVNIGDIQAFLQYMNQFNQPLRQTATIANVIQGTAAASERVFELLGAKDEVKDSKDAVEITNIKGDVSFKDISFSYDGEVDVIKHFSADIKAGQRVAIVGPTGAGKTTIVNLLMRFYDVNSGSITVDGLDLREIKRDSLRKLFGMVLQDTWLFSGTIRENLKYGKPDATDEDMFEAVAATHVDNIVDSLPNGYDMMIDEDADNLSQGEKQLMTIARAMLVDSPILILDEATSSVDTRTEVLIQKAMDKLMEGRTSFVIAHRLSTIKNADLILVMKNGNIVEKGTHDDLISQNGFYAELYNSQFDSES